MQPAIDSWALPVIGWAGICAGILYHAVGGRGVVLASFTYVSCAFLVFRNIGIAFEGKSLII